MLKKTWIERAKNIAIIARETGNDSFEKGEIIRDGEAKDGVKDGDVLLMEDENSMERDSIATMQITGNRWNWRLSNRHDFITWERGHSLDVWRE